MFSIKTVRFCVAMFASVLMGYGGYMLVPLQQFDSRYALATTAKSSTTTTLGDYNGVPLVIASRALGLNNNNGRAVVRTYLQGAKR